MPKVKASRHRVSRSEPFEHEAQNMKASNAVEDEPSDVAESESNRSIYKRQAVEWRQMKAQVSQLKLRRKSLTKKQRDSKKLISQEIKLLIKSMSLKHEKELRDLGIIPPKRCDMMEEDGEEDCT